MKRIKKSIKLFPFVFFVIFFVYSFNVFANPYKVPTGFVTHESYNRCKSYGGTHEMCKGVVPIKETAKKEESFNGKDSLGKLLLDAGTLDRSNESERIKFQEKANLTLQGFIKTFIQIILSFATIHALYVAISSILKLGTTSSMPYFRKMAIETVMKSMVILVLLSMVNFIFYTVMYFIGT